MGIEYGYAVMMIGSENNVNCVRCSLRVFVFWVLIPEAEFTCTRVKVFARGWKSALWRRQQTTKSDFTREIEWWVRPLGVVKLNFIFRRHMLVLHPYFTLVFRLLDGIFWKTRSLINSELQVLIWDDRCVLSDVGRRRYMLTEDGFRRRHAGHCIQYLKVGIMVSHMH